MKPFVKSLYWFTIDQVNMDIVRNRFSIEIFDKDTLEQVELRVYRVARIFDTVFVGLPRGRLDIVKLCLHDPDILDDAVDLRTVNSANSGLEMSGKYRDYQIESIKELSTCENGILESPPRTGKTIVGVGTIIKLKQKALILAHQTDLIEQFCNETIYDETGKLFNGNSLDRPPAAICSKYEDFEKYDICLATYQTFISDKGQKLLKKIRHMFGVVFTDEVHRSGANWYTRILSKFSAKHMLGCTATPDRKDGRFILSELVVGPVVHRTSTGVLVPTVYGHKTGFYPGKNFPNHWTYAMNRIFTNKKRNELIAKLAVRDAKNGHTVLIPITRKQHAVELYRLVNGLYGQKVAFMFTGSIPKNRRQWARDQMNENERIKVCIATRSMLTGMNVPRWSCIYSLAPISNPPQYTQEVFRICTPKKGKRPPIIRYFFDESIGLSYGCLHTCAKTLTNGKFTLHKSFIKLLESINFDGYYEEGRVDPKQKSLDKTRKSAKRNYGTESLNIKQF